MKNKILFSALFMFFILVLLSINNISSAFTFEIDNTTYDTDELGFETLKYNIVYKNMYNGINFFTSENKAIFEGENLKFLPKTISYQYLSSSRKWTTSVYDEGVTITGMKGYFSSGTISCSYLNYDVLDDEGNVIINKINLDGTEEPNYRYFNFTYNNVNYSLNVTNDILRDYMAIFKVGNYAILFTSDDSPSHKYIDNTDYLATTSFTNLSSYNLSTGENVLYSSESVPEEYIKKYTGYFENGTDFAFHTDNLIYSNFVLYDKNGNVLFQPSELTLASVLNSVEPEKILSQIIGLLPAILALIVFCLGLRKAIKELLRKAQI